MRKLVAAALAASLVIFPANMAASKSGSFKKWKDRAPVAETLKKIWNGGTCQLSRFHLTYFYGKGKQKEMLVVREEGEKAIDLVCGEETTVILMTRSISLYPGARVLERTDPADLDYYRVEIGSFEEGHISPNGKYLVFRNKNHIETVKIEGDQIIPLDSYELGKDVEKVEAQNDFYLVHLKDGRTILYSYGDT